MARDLTTRRFMEAAVDEMRLSRAEHADKHDPLVGAVLVDARGRELGRAHRGNFSAGDHAEFTLLEKVLTRTDARGFTLYTTLEPCTSRKQPKRPCAHRVVEKGIARVFIGMPDPNPDIHGKGVEYLRHNGVVVEFFDRDLAEQIRHENKEFIEHFENSTYQRSQGSFSVAADTSKSVDVFSGPSYEENRAVPSADPTDLSHVAIRRYLRARGLNLKIPSPALWQFLRKAGFLADRTRGQAVPTVSGIVVFGEHPGDLLPQSKVTVVRLKSDSEHDLMPENISDEIPGGVTGPLFHTIERIERFFRKHVASVPRIVGSERQIGPEYPWEVVREALVNALVHRDYRDGANVQFLMLNDRIIVKSPGPPVQPLTIDKIRSYDVDSLRRNPHIARAASHMRYMEELGSGIRAMVKRSRDYGLRPPEFDFRNGLFVVTLYGRGSAPGGIRMTAEVASALREEHRLLLDLIGNQGRLTSREATARLRVSRETANQYFQALIKLRLIERRGTGRSTYYTPRGA
jgi:ATP-dependent DNA helicase RecG